MAYAVSFEGERAELGVELVEDPEHDATNALLYDPAARAKAKAEWEAEEDAREVAYAAWAKENAGRGILGGILSGQSLLLPRERRPFPEIDGFVDDFPANYPRPRRPDPEVRYVGTKMVSVQRTLGGFRKALVIDFVAATSDDLRLNFVRTWGIPGWSRGPTHMHHIEALQWAMTETLDKYRAGDPAAANVLSEKREWADLRPRLVASPTRPAPILSFVTKNLAGFMCLEIATMVGSRAKVMRCEVCSSIYVAGGYDEKHRRVSKYCSNRCRVAAQRIRAEEEAAKPKKRRRA